MCSKILYIVPQFLLVKTVFFIVYLCNIYIHSDTFFFTLTLLQCLLFMRDIFRYIRFKDKKKTKISKVASAFKELSGR